MPSPSRLHRRLANQPTELANAIAASRMLFRVGRLLRACIDEALAPFGIDMHEYLALVLIADHAIEPLRPSDLSTTLDATRTQITRLLDDLERKKLAQRLPGREDRRSFEIALTPTGRSRLREATPKVHAAYSAVWAPLGADGTRELLAQFEAVHGMLQARNTP